MKLPQDPVARAIVIVAGIVVAFAIILGLESYWWAHREMDTETGAGPMTWSSLPADD